jgi:putative flavoprotein involved in K+ transport
LAIGYYLKKTGKVLVIVDANERSSDSWRKRRESLRLFAPAL